MYEVRGKHSEKPGLTYLKIFEKFKVPSLRCCEIFARRLPPIPFDAYGNELQNSFVVCDSTK